MIFTPELISLLKASSPFVAAGIIWKGGYLLTLRKRQRAAILCVCEHIERLDPAHAHNFFYQIHALRSLHTNYSKLLFDRKTPVNLTEEMIKLDALVESVWAYWQRHESTPPDRALPQQEILQGLKGRADELRKKRLFVLYSL